MGAVFQRPTAHFIEESKKMTETLDTYEYHQRYDLETKNNIIHEYIFNNNVTSVLDIGCNSGAVSRPLLEKKIKVIGMDLQKPEKLHIHKNYRFIQGNIIDTDFMQERDCTLFLSIYHHLLTNHGIEKADEVFYKLLFKSKYLIFDTGIPEDTGGHPVRKRWVNALKQHFNTQTELFDHFGVPYKIIGEWSSNKCKRKIIVFSREDAENSLLPREKYRRYKKSKNAHLGLIPEKDWEKTPGLFRGTEYYKYQIGNKILFGKTYINNTIESIKDWKESGRNAPKIETEIKNLLEVWQSVDQTKLITYYGHIKKYNCILFPFIENFKHISSKNVIKIKDKKLTDVDSIKVGDNTIYIDFAW